jgi:hypothetical protein
MSADLPVPDYDGMDPKQIADSLHARSQVELAAIEDYERANDARPAVLDKLKYMRTSEPVDGYDAMSADEVVAALAQADAAGVRAIRDYERRFQHRRTVLDEAARVLPGARANAEETRAREAKAEAVRRAMRSVDAPGQQE